MARHFGDGALFQLHWENRSNPAQTLFVAQGVFDSAFTLTEWAERIILRRNHEIPAGWWPLILSEGDPRFVVAAIEQQADAPIIVAGRSTP